MKHEWLFAAGLVLTLIAGGNAMTDGAKAHESRGSGMMPMMEPGYGSPMRQGGGHMQPGYMQHEGMRQDHGRHQGWHHGWHMGSRMMGHGMMSPGSGMAPRGAFRMSAPFASDLTVEQVQHVLGHHIEWLDLSRLKVGEITEKDEDTILAEIVTQDGSLVQRLEVDRHSGWARPTE